MRERARQFDAQFADHGVVRGGGLVDRAEFVRDVDALLAEDEQCDSEDGEGEQECEEFGEHRLALGCGFERAAGGREEG